MRLEGCIGVGSLRVGFLEPGCAGTSTPRLRSTWSGTTLLRRVCKVRSLSPSSNIQLLKHNPWQILRDRHGTQIALEKQSAQTPSKRAQGALLYYRGVGARCRAWEGKQEGYDYDYRYFKLVVNTSSGRGCCDVLSCRLRCTIRDYRCKIGGKQSFSLLQPVHFMLTPTRHCRVNIY